MPINERLKSLIRKPVKTIARAGAGVLPDFIIVGVQKGGTTSLFQYLAEHPQVFAATTKELHYFDKGFQRGPSWYRRQFPSGPQVSRQEQAIGKRVVTGESSPYYMFHPHAPRRMAELVPEAKLIALLRDPVKRAISHYHHEVRLGFETLSIEEAVDQEQARLSGETDRMIADESLPSFAHQHHSYVSRGIYVDQLEHLRRYYPEEQLLVLGSEEFFADVQGTLDRVTEYLGLDPFTLAKAGARNKGTYEEKNVAIEARLREFYRPHNARLFENLGREFGWPL